MLDSIAVVEMGHSSILEGWHGNMVGGGETQEISFIHCTYSLQTLNDFAHVILLTFIWLKWKVNRHSSTLEGRHGDVINYWMCWIGCLSVDWK